MKKRYKIIATCFDKRGRKISSAENNYKKSHPLQAKFALKAEQPKRIFLHAELLAILRARQVSVHKIRIERRDAKGKLVLSKPCKVCEQAIREAKIKLVEYTL
jgi:deoxycytidylate deaminase